MVSSEGVRPWRANGAFAAASHSIRGRKAPSRPTVQPRPANGSGADAGSKCGGRPIPTTGRIRRGRSTRGPPSIRIIGVRTARRMRSTASAIAACSRNATRGDAYACLQRWTRQRLQRLCHQGFTGCCRCAVTRLQRWTRGRCKLPRCQRLMPRPGDLAKRGRDRHSGLGAVPWRPWRPCPPRPPKSICTGWNCALPRPGCWNRERSPRWRSRSNRAAS